VIPARLTQASIGGRLLPQLRIARKLISELKKIVTRIALHFVIKRFRRSREINTEATGFTRKRFLPDQVVMGVWPLAK